MDTSRLRQLEPICYLWNLRFYLRWSIEPRCQLLILVSFYGFLTIRLQLKEYLATLFNIDFYWYISAWIFMQCWACNSWKCNTSNSIFFFLNVSSTDYNLVVLWILQDSRRNLYTRSLKWEHLIELWQYRTDDSHHFQCWGRLDSKHWRYYSMHLLTTTSGHLSVADM